MKKYIFFLILSITIVSCNDNCNDLDAPASPSLFLDIIDEVTEENVFEDSIYLDTQVLVLDFEENDVPFNVVFDSRLMHIVLEKKIWLMIPSISN